MEELTNEEMLQIVEKLLIKTTEVAALLKDGKIIVAHEKLGGGHQKPRYLSDDHYEGVGLK
jgi:hypothetical protein